MPAPVRTVFDFQGVTLRLDQILPIRQVKENDHCFGKYKAILASIKEVGVIEPLVVYPQRGSKGSYLLLDGHMRLKALAELGQVEAPCIVSKDDDAYTYNDKVNRIAVIQEHKMIVKAIEHGVSPEQIARALDVNVERIIRRIDLLDGIHPDAVELLKDKPITVDAVRLFKKVKAVRQLEFAQLMVSGGNYTRTYAKALLVGTSQDMLVNPKAPKPVRGLKAEDIAQMEREMETLEKDFRIYQENYGENTLTLNVVQRYVKKLIENLQVKKFLSKRHPDLLDELSDLAGMESL